MPRAFTIYNFRDCRTGIETSCAIEGLHNTLAEAAHILEHDPRVNLDAYMRQHFSQALAEQQLGAADLAMAYPIHTNMPSGIINNPVGCVSKVEEAVSDANFDWPTESEPEPFE